MSALCPAFQQTYHRLMLGKPGVIDELAQPHCFRP